MQPENLVKTLGSFFPVVLEIFTVLMESLPIQVLNFMLPTLNLDQVPGAAEVSNSVTIDFGTYK
jgi:hypothetical protein